MAENPIRAALEVAARAAARACWNENVQADHLPAMIEAEWPQHVEGVAAIVAAFLRAVPSRVVTDEFGTVWVGWFGEDLAAAVDKAAKGAGA